MRVLITGATGYIGGRLVPRLVAAGHDVVCLARHPSRLAGREWGKVEVRHGDVLDRASLDEAFVGVEVAYYLIHSMERAPARGRDSPFPERERIAAENFAAAAARAGVPRLVYLGGPTASWTTAGAHARERPGAGERGEPASRFTGEHAGSREAADGDGDDGENHDEDVLSPHLRSREAVERILRDAVPDTVVLRASIVIGARSRSFRFLVRLVERMPVLALPAWHTHRTRPIDARDVIDMLAAAATGAATAGRSLDVGGPDILSYGEMIRRIAELLLLARPAVGMGVSGTPLTARVAAAIAGEDPEFVSALMESLQGDLLPGGEDGSSHLRAAEMLGVDLHSFDSAVERSLREWESTEELAAR
jgi:uncharacterized protein YbjT (DUF2867 family)